MTDREVQMLMDAINGLAEEFHAFTLTCVPCRASVNILDSQRLDARLTKVERNWTLLVGAMFGGSVLGSGGVTLALKYFIGA